MSRPLSRRVAAIAIGRNEGERLGLCLASLSGRVEPVIYVDSGSDDDSISVALGFGADVVKLDFDRPFTAARARNAGIERLRKMNAEVDYIQFVDGDCELRDGWIETASSALDGRPDVAVVCGRRHERFPGASVWNGLIDEEWNTPVGEARSCGGDAMIRSEAVFEVGGYREDLIAGEEPEMCVRLRNKGWKILRLDAEMTWHDAEMKLFRQWWRRCRRGGHAFAEVSSLHAENPDRFWIVESRRALFWGAVIPLASVLGAAFTPWALMLLLIYPAQVLRLRLRGYSWRHAFFLLLSKFPEAQGATEYYFLCVTGRRRGLIEYK